MTAAMLRDTFAWATVLNYGLLTFWFVLFVRHPGRVHALHQRWFRLSRQDFDRIHYGLMGAWKIGVFLLLLMPAIALRIVVGG